MKITQFAYPDLLWLLLLLVPLIALYVYRTFKGGAAITISTTRSLEAAPKGAKYYLRHLPFVLRCATIGLIIVGLARPQSSETEINSKTQGIDIMMSLDVSGSMLARDFEPNRLIAAKDVAAKFIADRPNDRIGLVVFAGESFTQSPLTTDKTALQNLLGQVDVGMMDDGTAIGNGLATAVNRLKESSSKSKVIILLTDGVNNAGHIAPLTAAEIAYTYGIKIYTVGVGTRGMAPYPQVDIWGRIVGYVPTKVEIDEKMLTEIAESTGGEYFRATDKQTLQDIYERINEMETTEVETSERVLHKELFGGYVLLALALLVLEFLIKSLWLRRIP